MKQDFELKPWLKELKKKAFEQSLQCDNSVLDSLIPIEQQAQMRQAALFKGIWLDRKLKKHIIKDMDTSYLKAIISYFGPINKIIDELEAREL